jgi:RNA polymerase sigma-70 factor (ECF subfamily)
MDDGTIIRLMKRRPDKGIYEAIRKYEGVLTAVASRLLSSKEDVEECVSDAFVGMWRHVDGLDAEAGSLKGYLICSVRNHAINRYKQLKRGNVVTLTEDVPGASEEDDPEGQVLWNADAEVLLELIRGLEDVDRAIMTRKYFLFEKNHAIADGLNLEPNQVKYRLQRTKTKLREALLQRGIAI